VSSVNDHLAASVHAAGQQPCRPLPVGDAPSDGPPDLGTADQPEQAFAAPNIDRLLRYLHSRQPGKPSSCAEPEPTGPGEVSPRPTVQHRVQPDDWTPAPPSSSTHQEQT